MSISLTTALTAPTQFATTPNGKVAYRIIGKGKPLLLCNRFRGTLDTWDPKFLVHLAKGFQVILFDYNGIGLSTGHHQPTSEGVANDLKFFMEALKIEKAIVAGWSYGGVVAQTFAAIYYQMVSHLVVIGSNPPGKNETPPEKVFFDAAFKPINDFNDEVVLFFEPKSEKSIAAAKASHERIAMRKKDLDKPVTPAQFETYAKGVMSFAEDALQIRDKLNNTALPILVLMGDHDSSFPVANWFPLIGQSNTMQLIILSKTGHGPQHEQPKLCASYIKKFIKNTNA